MRYRFFPAPLGRICCEPFEGEIGSDKTNGVTSATARQHHSKAAARSRRELKGSNTMAYRTVNRYDNHVVATFDDLTDQQVTQLVAQAQNTFESWSQKSFDERAAVCRRAAAILRERADEFARLLTLEMGKLYAESLGEVQLAAEIFDYYAENAEAFLAPERLNTASSDDDAVLVSAPLGVILGIQPWNFPYYQLVRVAAPNLMAGNVVMVKHASNVPQAAAAFERLLAEAGAPQGAYTNLYATKDQLSLLIDDPRVRGVALTGSEGAGAVVAARAGKNLKKSTLELGGSDALIALADQRNIDLGLVAPPPGSPPATLRCAAGDLRSVLDNLIENALRYTPEGGVVDVRLASQDGRPAVEVIDTGPGIPPDLLARVFDRFFRVPGSQARGSGLGLAIAQAAAQRCGLRIRLRNRDDRSGLVARVEPV